MLEATYLKLGSKCSSLKRTSPVQDVRIELILPTFIIRAHPHYAFFHLKKSVSYVSRYKKVKDIENRWYTNKQLVKASYVAFGLLLLYGVICTFINSHFELQSYNIYNVCLHGENAKKNKILFNCLTIMLPVVIMVIAAGVVDLLSYFWLQKRENNSRREYIKNDIPLRATAISTSLHAIFIFVFVILGIQKVQPIDKYLIATVLIRIDNILRNPLTAVFTFKINDETRQKNVAKERERKRQAVIQDALRQREEIKLEGNKARRLIFFCEAAPADNIILENILRPREEN